MSEADFVQRFDAIGLAELGDAFESLRAQGAALIRATPLPGSTGYILEGWRMEQREIRDAS